MSQQVCAVNFPAINFVIGKRDESDEKKGLKRSGTHIDGGCCTEDLCNNKSPVAMEVVVVSSTSSSKTSNSNNNEIQKYIVNLCSFFSAR